MATGNDVQKWIRCQTIAEESFITVNVSGDYFELINKKNKHSLGKLHSVDSLFAYLCGYSASLESNRAPHNKYKDLM